MIWDISQMSNKHKAATPHRFPETNNGERWSWLSALGADVPATAKARTYSYTKSKRTLRAADGPSAEWLAERDAARNDITFGSAGNRIERALVKDGSPLAMPLRRVAELLRPPVVAANDNSPSDGDDNTCTGLERVHGHGCFEPSIPMLLRAYAAGIKTGSREVKDGWHRIGHSEARGQLTGLTFLNGELVEFGDNKGRKRRPSYNPKIAEEDVDPKSITAKHTSKQESENVAYTKLRGAATYVSAQSPSAPRSLANAPRTSRAIANDNLLAKAIANTPVMPTAKVLPDGVAAEYGRLAGISDLTGTGEGKTSAPMHTALAEMERVEFLEAAGIDAEDLQVVEHILADASFRTIGLALGYAESSAHKSGRAAVKAALKRISKKIAA